MSYEHLTEHCCPRLAPDLKGQETRGRLFELRARGREGSGRAFYCFASGRRVVIVHAFVKKSRDTPDSELKIARKRMKEVGSVQDQIPTRAARPQSFLARSSKRRGFRRADASLEEERALVSQMLSARERAGLTQDAVAARMGTTKSAVSRLGTAGGHAPSFFTLRKHARAVGCRIAINLVSE